MDDEQATRVLEAINNLDKRMEVVVTNCQHCQKVMGEHHATLYGNGKEGLREMLLLLEGRIARLADQVTRIRRVESGSTKWYQKTLGTVILTLVAIVAGAFGIKAVEWQQPPEPPPVETK